MGRQRRQVWRRCRRLVADLVLPDPFDIEEFIATLSERRGRPIELVPVTTRAYSPCGMLVTTDRAEYILYPSDTTELHQRHILLHEVGHLLCDHADSAGLDASASQLLMPHLSPDLVRRVLGRTVYTEVQEQEAELIASLILHRAAGDVLAPPRPATAEIAAGLARLGSLFGTPSRRGHTDG